LIIISVLAFSSDVLAQSLVFSVLEDLPPYQYNENGALKGIDLEIGEEIFKRLGFKIIYKPLPWTRTKKYAAEGKIDGILSMFCLDKYLEILDFAESALTSKLSVFAPKESHLKITHLMDLKGKSVGVIRGYTYSSEFDNYKDFNRFQCDDDKMLIRILEKGRIDVAVAEALPFWFISRQLGLQSKFKELYTLTETKICIGFSKKALGSKSRILADRTSKIFLDLKAEGVIRKILDKYLK
jgi:polar amino acid transport system substrate-binding protein